MLNINYRFKKIVKKANDMINKVARKVGFDRLKNLELIGSRNSEGNEKFFTKSEDGIKFILNSFKNNENVAVLCRSNVQCLETKEILNEKGIEFDKINVTGEQDFRLERLRDYGLFSKLLEQNDHYLFFDEYALKKIIEKYKNLDISDYNFAVKKFYELFELVKKECGRPRVIDIINFIHETKLSDIDRLKSHHLIGWNDSEDTCEVENKITISTIHKIKGLEYETVVILPSKDNFPINGGNADSIDSAEEARLYYVAMTRARDNLYWGFRKRERSWHSGISYLEDNNNTNKGLSGAIDEIYISWSAMGDKALEIQDYIEQKISINDMITRPSIDSRDLFHNEKQIGKLSKWNWYSKSSKREKNSEFRI